MLYTTRHGPTGNGLSSAARIKSLRRGSICPKAPVLLLLGLTVRTPPQAGKDCVRDNGSMILVPGSTGRIVAGQ